MRSRRNRTGFILITSLLTLTTIATIVTSVILSSRSRIQLVANIRMAAEAEAVADGMINIMILDRYRALQQGQRSLARVPWNGSALVCKGPNSAIATLIAEDEGGKVDLNTASAPLLALLIERLGASSSMATAIVGTIETYRNQRFERLHPGGFTSIQELSDALQFEPALVRSILPHVTVHSRQPGIDETVATQSTIKLLSVSNGSAEMPRIFQQPSSSRVFRFIADVSMPNGARFIREAVVELRPESASPFVIVEWQRGSGDVEVHKSSNVENEC